MKSLLANSSEWQQENNILYLCPVDFPKYKRYWLSYGPLSILRWMHPETVASLRKVGYTCEMVEV